MSYMSNRNINDFYNLIQNENGLRYNYQFLVKLTFDKKVFQDRGGYSAADYRLFQQLGLRTNDILEVNPNDTATDLTFFAKGTKLPQTTLDATQVQYFAQGFRFPGIIKYDSTWTVNILLDQKLTIYRQLRLWQEMMSSLVRNSGGNKVIPQARGKLILLGAYGDRIGTTPDKIYAMEGIFPTIVPQIDMKYVEGSSNIKDMQVTFALQFFRDISDNPNVTDPFQEY